MRKPSLSNKEYLLKKLAPNKDTLLYRFASFLIDCHDKWIEVANIRLNRTSNLYISALREPQIKNYVGYLTLDGSVGNGFVHDIEWGRPAWDLRHTILKGARFKRIPFTHDPSETTRSKIGQILGKPYVSMLQTLHGKEAGEKMAEEIASSVRGALKYRRFRKQISGPAVYSNLLLKPWHTSGIYSRIRKEKLNDKIIVYKTYRTISQTSSPESWRHPGIIARMLHEEVLKYIYDNIDSIWGV